MYAVIMTGILLKARPGALESVFIVPYSISTIAVFWISFGYSLLLLVPFLTYGCLAYSEKENLERLREKIKMLEGTL